MTKTSRKGTWKPLLRNGAMLGDKSFQLGVGPAALAIPILIKFGLPLVAWAGGAFVATKIVSNTLPAVPLNKEKIGLSSALIGGGLTSYFVSQSLPEDWRPIAYALAVAGVSAGSYFLFTPSGKEPNRRTASKFVPTNEVVPNYTPGAMIENFRVHIDKKAEGGWNRWPYSDQTYEALVTNDGPNPVTFYAGIGVYAEGPKLLYRSPAEAPSYGRTRWTVQPTKQEAITVTIPPWKDWSERAGKDVGVDFEFFRQQTDKDPFKVSETFPITYSLIPFMGSAHLGQVRLR